jgi:hypothetical protein
LSLKVAGEAVTPDGNSFTATCTDWKNPLAAIAETEVVCAAPADRLMIV